MLLMLQLRGSANAICLDPEQPLSLSAIQLCATTMIFTCVHFNPRLLTTRLDCCNCVDALTTLVYR